ncbi:ComF family protein [Microbacterium sp. NPDC091313]
MFSALVRAALADALTFVLPVDCAGCGAADETLCAACRQQLTPDPLVRRLGSLEVRSGVLFDGPAARVIRALKEDGRTGLARELAPALRAAAGGWDEDGIVVVPVPTSAAAMRRRGFRVGELLARAAGWRPERMLRLERVTADQRALDVDARARNAAGSMSARGAAGARVLVVDDVVTSGATLREAARALTAAGADVVGAVTAAAVPRRQGTLNRSIGERW